VCNFVFFKCKPRLGDGHCKSLVATWPVEIFQSENPEKIQNVVINRKTGSVRVT